MRILLAIVCCMFFSNTWAQHHHSVKIDLSNQSIVELAKLGLDVEHGEYAPGKQFIGVFSDREIEKIQQAGFSYDVLIENLSDYRRAHRHDTAASGSARNAGPCEEETIVSTPPDNFDLGSFGGFFTYEEMIEQLDAMATQYPDLITIKAPVSDILTHENRPIYWIKISDNPSMNEVEPEVLYTAVHHAREPGGLSSLIYFMWHILENYESDERVKALVDETELYFIPCLNPDGYIYNVDQYFNGGNFFWRKNRRDNGDGTFGVDLNRNYGYEFAHDDIGSSPSTDDQTYRGPAGFSEPETQAAKWFCENHEFQIALNYHTFGNLLIYPWGFDASGVADDVFLNLAAAMVEENDFFVGTGFETVGYFVNGDSDDWMFGEQSTKDLIYSLTPELGLGGFYPDQENILGILASSLPQNMATGLLVHSYAMIEEQNDLIISSINSQDFAYSLQNVGLMAGSMTVSLEAISANIETTGGAQTFNLNPQEAIADAISYDLADDITAGEEVVFELSVDNGQYTITDTITKIFGMLEVISNDPGDNLDNWSSDTWATTTEDFVSANSSITDSPNSNYELSSLTTITTTSAISLVDLSNASLRFWAKWDIEGGWDFAQVSISQNGGVSYEPQCGLYTKTGNGNQDTGQPLYDGRQSDWVREEIDLSDYIGTDILIRFSLFSDAGVVRDGFYFDDLEVVSLIDNSVSTQSLSLDHFQVRSYPNPTSQVFKLELSGIIPQSRLNIYNAQGQGIYQQAYKNETVMNISVEGWSKGIYYYELKDQETGAMSTGKILVQ